MSSAINPLGNPSQATVAGNPVTKATHAPASATSYSEPSLMPQSLGIVHTNTNAAHSHPNQHHYSLNVPSTPTGHYTNQNLGQIPASNHPVAANSGSTGAVQGYTLQKNVSNYASNHEDNIFHQQNQSSYPPVSQTLPSSVPSQSKATSEKCEQQQSDIPHSNGTSEVKSPQKSDSASGLSLTPKEKSVQPAPVPQLCEVQEKAEEKPVAAPSSIPMQLPQIKPVETTNTKVSIDADIQQTETSALTATINSTSSSSAHTRNNNKSSASTTVDTSGKEPELKKAKADENPVPSEKLENLKKNKPIENDKEGKIENSKTLRTEPMTNNDERVCATEKTCPKEDPLAIAMPTEASAKSPPARKAKHPPSKSDDSSKSPKDQKIPSSVQKSPLSTNKAKRQRVRTQPYQSPLPEVELISKISSLPLRTPRSSDDKLIVFYKKEFLAVRNAEASFYLCQTMQNIYKSSSKIKIRWLSQDSNDKSGEIYTPDFYDLTDFDCILTNLSLDRIDKGKFKLPPSEKDRTQSILNRSLAVEKGEVTSPSLTEEHPDGLDLSLYRDEDQLKKRSTRKRKSGRKPSSSSAGKRGVSIRDSPEAAKVRKISPPQAKTPARNAAVRKTHQSSKKTTTQPEIKRSATSSKRALVRGRRKTDHSDTSPVIDQKKAKVLAKIGRKTAVPAAKSIQSNAKSVKSRTKSGAPSKNSTQVAKASSSGTAKSPPKHARRSTRK